MTEFIGWFGQHPLRILALAAVYLVAFALLRQSSAAPRANALLVPAGFCVGFAAWEAWVLVQSPDADIRVDLLLIWPLLLVCTLWAVVRIARRRSP